MKKVDHVMILASAGSGKTYELTNRFVRLLALGAKPERIVALTFTRKAAAEFFDEILKKLAQAAASADLAGRLAAQIEEPALGCADFQRMLRGVVEAMPRLQLGTLDGFFARIARNFPFELGLTGSFEILQEHAARTERARVLRRMFERTGELDDSQREFIEAFKRATFGVEEKRLGQQLDEFIDRHQSIFLAAPMREHWGNPRRIWSEGCEWLESVAKREAAVQALREALTLVPMNPKQAARWTDFFAALDEWAPGAGMPRPMEYLLTNAFKAWPALEEVVVERKSLALPAPVREALKTVMMGIVGAELARRMEVTCGIFAVLAGYEAHYHDAVRRAGKLTFGDVERLLLPTADSGLVLSRQPTADGRLYIDYRLDSETDHWLLDEFQDTSFGQWSVLRSLIDEAVQDPTGTRSFFYVGDVKQAIFAWRDGDPRLFREIFDHYNDAQPGTIAEKHLVRSWRSGPPLIAAINQVFGAAGVMSQLFPGSASTLWNREWRAHESACPERAGQAAWLHAEQAADRFAVTLALLEELAPLERGLSCAVLVQKNSTAVELADYLRREGGLPALAESDLHVATDNPLGRTLLALVQAAAHPGDTLAQEYLQMTPLGLELQAADLTTPELLTRHVLAQVHAEGFERALMHWLKRLEAHLPADDAFNRERGRQFLAAAGLFDASGSRDVAEFIQFMERHTVRESESAAVIRVMTVHKSKGLGFDLVILPDLEGTKLDCRRDGLAVQRASDRAVQWVLDLPGRLFTSQDAVLAEYVRRAEADGCYENISLLYVAMTRAKRAMYLVTKAPRDSTSNNFPRVLAETLGADPKMIRVGRREFEGSYAEGEPDWHLRLTPPAAKASASSGLPVIDPKGLRRPARLAAHRPSSGHSGELSGAQLFSLEAGRSAEFGTSVHRLLAEVEWMDAHGPERFVRSWNERGADEQVIAEASRCLRAQPGVWARGERSEAWRERAFEIVLDDAWVTGVFDRVVIVRGADGRALAARVYDFKTDRVPAESDAGRGVERHRNQMELYRRVAARLTGLPEQKVEGFLIFTGPGISCPV